MSQAPANTTANAPAKLGVVLPFLIVTLIWGSTWLVIRDQISAVPASWSVTYRFSIAAIGMFALTLIMRQSLRLDALAMRWTFLLGGLQFGLNFNFVYAAEKYITSGLVAVIFALLIVPNALLGKWWLGRNFGRSFLVGSIIACIGVALLMVQEYRSAPVGGTEVVIGFALALAAVMCASVSNVVQGLPAMNRYPTTAILSWSMLWGALANTIWSWASFGPPVIETRSVYLGGLFYLGIVGSVFTFPLYFKLIRDIGPGKAAYTSVLIPVVAMLLSTLFEDYEWTMLAAGGAAFVVLGLAVAMRAR